MNLPSLTQKITTRTVVILFIIVSTLLTALSLYKTPNADASVVSGFRAGRIIDDAVFYNAGSMSASQIQTFLDSKVTCDTYGTGRATDWGRSDITRATLASYIRNGTNGYTKNPAFHAPPYTCLKDFKQNTPQIEAASGLCGGIPARANRTAAQIILDVSNACGINPQVLLVLLEKEQSLVTDIWPLNHQYNRATGFACPDNVGGACDPKFNGFYSQVYAAARQFKVYRAYPTSYNYIAGRTNNIFWQTNGGNFESNGSQGSMRSGQCGYSRVTIENQATAALYIYTPYRPNGAALNNYPGTGDSCSAYGNRNFYGMFTSWFGSPLNITESERALSAIESRYQALGGNSSALGRQTGSIGNSTSSYWIRYANGYIVWSPSSGAWESYGDIRTKWAEYDYQHGKLGFPTGPVKNTARGDGTYQQYQKGFIIGNAKTGYWESKGSIREHWGTLGYQNGSLGFPTGPEERSGDTWTQKFENGIISGGAGGFSNTSTVIYNYWKKLGLGASKLGFPTGPVKNTARGDGTYQQYQKGFIIGNAKTGYWESKGSIREHWGTLGYQNGSLGFPTGPEERSGDTWTQKFENGIISGGAGGFSNTSTVIYNYWKKLGLGASKLGFPTGPVKNTARGDGTYQQYQKGFIIGNAKTGYWESKGSIREHWGTLGYQNGSLGFPTGPEERSGDTWTQKFENGTISFTTGKGASHKTN